MASENGSLEITWGRAFQVWRCYIWRVVLVGALMGGLASFLSKIAEGESVLERVLTVLFYVVAVGVSLWVSVAIMRAVLRQTYSDFKIVLLPITQEDGPSLTDRLSGRIGAKE